MKLCKGNVNYYLLKQLKKNIKLVITIKTEINLLTLYKLTERKR